MKDRNRVLYDVTNLPRRVCKKCTLNLPSREYSSNKTDICRECTTRSDREPRKPKVDVPEIKFNEIHDGI